MSDSPFRTVTIVGATGTLGYHIADAFLNDGSYKVKILRRNPENVNAKANSLAERGAEIVYADYGQKDDLVKALKGTDVLVSTVSYKQGNDNNSFYEVQLPLLNAAKEAGVKRFIPSEFGSEFKGLSHQLSDDKAKFRAEVEKSGLEYTIIFTGLFYEFLDWIGFDVKKKKATFYTDPNLTISTTSLHDVGKYTVESLKIPEARNAHIRVAGTTLSFNELLKKFEEASGECLTFHSKQLHLKWELMMTIVKGSKWEVVEDREIRKRFREKIDPVPLPHEEMKAFICENARFAKTDNDKFSFTPSSINDAIEALVKGA
ncbi:12537_t:CDS:2 [Funneliformis geosporum]|uniref:16372_t:CDS:1 n=1 Tax=Funneliformis geosporum TaxID=1117311 RepID=A0A9W4WPS0_9GLOM|nr:12537_t:CDS:2 [Funneliformis geosporum]CAI2177863.1 16372_t:CDS:2 [Funneliformis geosporum]